MLNMLAMVKSLIHNMTAPEKPREGGAEKVTSLYEGSAVKEYKIGKNTGGGAIFPRPAFVMVYAPWCPHCVNSAADYKTLAESIGDYIHVIAVNGDEPDNKEFLATHKIRGFPTLLYADEDTSLTAGGISEVDMSDTSRDLSGFVKKICKYGKQPEDCCDMTKRPYSCSLKKI